MLPLNEGRRGFWHIQRELKKRSATTDVFQQLLEVDNDDEYHNYSSKSFIEENKINMTNYNHVNSLSTLQNEVVVLDTPIEDNSKYIVMKDDKTMHWLENVDFLMMDIRNNENNPNAMNKNQQNNDEEALHELLEQVAELDVIYQDHQIKKQELEQNLDQVLPKDIEQQMVTEFDDAATYSSLQKAFKHPIVFADAPPIPPKPGQVFDGASFDLILPPIIINSATSDALLHEDDEKLPPLPPKRAKKISESIDKENNNELNENVLVRNSSTRSLTSRPQSQPIVIKSADLRRSPSNKLPPKVPPKGSSQAITTTPINTKSNTLPKQKKSGFFSKIFSRRKSRGGLELDSSVTDSIDKIEIDINDSLNESEKLHDNKKFCSEARGSIRSTNSLRSPATKPKASKPVGRSVSSASGKRPNLTPDVVYIPLKGDSSNSLPLHQSATHLSLPGSELYERASTASLQPLDRKTISALQLAELPIQDGDMELVAIADAQSLRNLCESGEHGIILDSSVDLTEAEHYALYTTLAPHATESEFDENSCYYQPIEGGQILSSDEVAQRLLNNIEF